MDSAINWIAIAAVAGLLAVVVAVVTAGIAARQVYLSRLALGVELILKLETRFFDTEDMVESRKTAAAALRASPLKEANIENVLDFFETLGLLVRRKAMELEIAWNTFFYWEYGYWKHCHPFIMKQRAKYPTRYEELMWLHEEFVRIEQKKRGPVDESEWDHFLTDEEQG